MHNVGENITQFTTLCVFELCKTLNRKCNFDSYGYHSDAEPNASPVVKEILCENIYHSCKRCKRC